ncbi:MAG: hypothetical protein GPJ54_03465 [Candidatus Heimdallarchaeota archaeon]|nr:hypothetical protein [Candidatus Heimdallarchaeota archaeon]
MTIVSTHGTNGLGYIESLKNDEADIIKYIDSLKDSKAINEMIITHKTKYRYWNQTRHDIDHPSISDTIFESGSMIIYPIIIEKGEQQHNILSPTAKSVRTLLTSLKQRFTNVKIKHLSSIPFKEHPQLLTMKQLEAINLGVEMGYYEIPRKFTLEQIGERIGIKRVAMQERLRRAENKILKNYYLTKL